MENRINASEEMRMEKTSVRPPSSVTEVSGQDDFIMHPTNDVCFAGLMENPVVRKGFCAAVMRVKPEEIEETRLLPTHLRREYADDKLGILDMRVCLKSGQQINMEMR